MLSWLDLLLLLVRAVDAPTDDAATAEYDEGFGEALFCWFSGSSWSSMTAFDDDDDGDFADDDDDDSTTPTSKGGKSSLVDESS